MATYRIDEKSEAVREVQSYLRTLASLYKELPLLSVDGIYGEETRDAVRLFQRMTGLTETGDTDEETFSLLYSMYLPVKEELIGESELFPSSAFPFRLGDSGSPVRILQSVLSEILTIHLPTDGFFGKTTEDAVRLIEGRYLLPQTGTVSRRLWQKISADYRAVIAKKF